MSILRQFVDNQMSKNGWESGSKLPCVSTEVELKIGGRNVKGRYIKDFGFYTHNNIKVTPNYWRYI